MSTKAGPLKTQKLRVDFVIKSRTDQFLCDPYAFDTPPLALESSDEMDKRVFLSLKSFTLRLYGHPDMFQFGRVDQILKYWAFPILPHKLQE